MEKKSRYTAAQNKATQKYQAANMEQLRIWTYRAEHMKDLVKVAADRAGVGQMEYMRDAIRARLDADGVTLDSLPPE